MVNYLTEAELKFQYLFCHKMAPWVALRQRAAFGAPNGCSCSWCFIGKANWSLSWLRHRSFWRWRRPLADITAQWNTAIPLILIWMQSLMPNPWGKYDMMKSFSRQKNIWRLFQGPILHVLIARSWFYSHRAPLYKLAAQRSKIFFLWFNGGRRHLHE